jgi:hypothetical protein
MEVISMTKQIKVLGGLAASITAILILIFLVFPDWKPAPTPPPPPPPPMGAELTNLSLEYRVTFADYLRSKGLPTNRYSPADLSYPGMIVHFTAKISGFKGQQCKVRGAIYDVQAGSKFSDLTDEEVLIPEANEDRASSKLWVPSPNRKGSFLVRLELYDPKGMRLVYTDSSPFYVN